jgi:hypothetical protein
MASDIAVYPAGTRNIREARRIEKATSNWLRTIREE